jgi:membrane associated rhomboid family serine protease
MSDQFQLWLIPPLLTALLSIWFRRRLTLEFGWPLLVQSFSIVVSGLLGLFVGPKPLWTVITWFLFVAFMVFPNLYLRHCENLYSTLNGASLLSACKIIPLFYWGKLGRFWKDIYLSYAFYINGDEGSGDALVQFWTEQKLPPFFTEHLDATKLAADGLLSRWDDIIDIFNQRRSDINSVSASLCLQASRAYAEKGDVEMATQCLKSANLPNQRMDQRHLSLVFLQYFCLTGAEDYAQQIIARLDKSASPSMNLILNAWWARCLISVGKTQLAIELLEKLLAQASTLKNKNFDPEPWIARLNKYMAAARKEAAQAKEVKGPGDGSWEGRARSGGDEDGQRLATSENIEQIWRVYQNSLSVQQIVLPKRSSKVVNSLLALMIAAYICSGCIDLIDNPFVLQYIGRDSPLVGLATNQGEFMFTHFYLEKGLVYAGQYYRLITYIFLHGNFSHLLLNSIGLFWFGRITESAYGTWRFLLIFLVSGIVGGLAQILFTDTSAVGASGSVFGLFAAVAVSIYKLRNVLPEQMRKRELRWMLVMTICQIGLDHVIPKVAGLAHLGGLAAGFILGIVLFPKQAFKSTEKNHE